MHSLFYVLKISSPSEKDLESRKWGKAAVGGPFKLTTHDGRPFTERDIVGKWNLVYFGFTNCPDICPEELDKMSAAVDKLGTSLSSHLPFLTPTHPPPPDEKYGQIVQPVFISVDPARDTVPQVARYVSEFHPRLVGLTGDYATLKATCKAYRVYFSTPPDAKADDDYLVDHSIFFYFMDPHGQFVDAFGKATTVDDVVARVQKEIASWKEKTGKTV